MTAEQSIAASAVVSLTDQQLATTVESETVVLQTDAGRYYGFNDVGSRVWELLESEPTVAELCDQIETEYDVTREQCQADVRALLAEMAEADLVTIEQPAH